MLSSRRSCTTSESLSLVALDPQSVDFSIKIFPNLTNCEIQKTDTKQLYQAIQTILNALYKQRNSVLRERPQLNESLSVTSLIYKQKCKKLHSQVMESEQSICDVTRGSID